MKKRGTGWIPDYPDVNDYTLKSEAIQNLSNKIQSHGDTVSIENLARKVYEALDILAAHYEKNGEDNGRLTKLRDGLEKEVLGDFCFVTVELHNVFKPEMADSEVLLIKNYLQRIISTWKQFKYIDYQPVMTDIIFDSKTHEVVIDILKTQGQSQPDGLVGKDEMKALKLLASGPDINRDIKFFDLFESNAEIYKEPKENIIQTIQNDDNSSNQFYQGILTVYLLPILKNLGTLQEELQSISGQFFRALTQESEQAGLAGLQAELSGGQSQVTPNELQNSLEKIDGYIQNLYFATEDIKRDQNSIKKIVDKFEDNLRKDGFRDDELRDLTDIKKKRVDKVIDPLSSLLQEYKSFKKDILSSTLEVVSTSEQARDLVQGSKTRALLSKVNNSMVLFHIQFIEVYEIFINLIILLYKACPPKIPCQLFQKIEIPVALPIDDSVAEILKKKLIDTQSFKLDDRQLEPENSSSIQQLTQLIKDSKSTDKLLQSLIEILAQILMPLDQYNNLNEAVERGIEKIQSLLEDKKDNHEKTKNLIRETMEEYNFGIIRDYSLIDELKFKDLILRALQEFKINIEKEEKEESSSIEEGILPRIKQQINKGPHLIEIIKKYLQHEHPQQEYRLANIQIKKPLFQVSIQTREAEAKATSSENTSSKTTEKSFQPMKNSLQFPISHRLRKVIDEIKEKASKNQKYDKSVFLSLPEFVDLSYWCSTIEDQGSLNSCTAHAGIALMEYAQKKSFGNYIDGSSRFLYKVTRNLMQREGDSGASVRDTMKAMVAFGVCPQEYWSSDEDKFDEEPTPFCYSFAENYKTLKYFRLDYGQTSRYVLLSQVKVLLASEIPCIFGFTLYNSVYDEFNVQRGHIPLPHKLDKVIGGHTVVAVGYHDRKVIENADGKRAEGALLIRNSWGTRWGQGGYGWLPYDYIVQGLTADWWSLLKAEWLATGRFGAGASAWNADKGGEGEKPPKQ